MFKRIVSCSVVFLFVLAASFTLCLILSGTPQLLHDGDTLNQEDRNAQIAFHQTEANHLEATLHIAPSLLNRDFLLIISDIRSFSLSVNGKILYRFLGTPATQRLHVLELQNEAAASDTLHIQITGLDLKSSIKAAIGSSENIRPLLSLTQSISSLLSGMYLAIIVVCLALYAHKRSESYLLHMVFFTLSVACTNMLYSSPPLPDFPFRDTLHMGYLHAVSQTLCLILCLKLMQLEPFPRFKQLYPLGLLFFSIAAVFLLNHFSYLLRLLFLDAIYLVTVCIVIYANAKGKRFSRLLLWGTALSGGLLLYNSLVNLGLTRPLFLMTFLHMPGLYFMLFDLSCLFVVCNIFAQKFTESEELVKVVENNNLQLDEKVRERTHALKVSNDMLIQEQKKKLAMTANLFHDLRSPLFCAIGYSEMIESRLPKPMNELSILQRELKYLSHLVENLFLISKLEEKQITFTRQPIDIQKLCIFLCEELRPEADSKEDTVILNLTPGLIVTGDGFRLKQALCNILSNAIEHNPNGTEIILSSSLESEHVVLSIEDHGIGISEPTLAHLFDRYYVRSPDHNRSGLGLPIAQELIAAHHGSIHVKSVVNEGTCFIITLPIRTQSDVSCASTPEC